MLKLTILPLSGGAMCPAVIDDGMEMVLIDCGTADSYGELVQIARIKEVDFDRLTKVIITHHDHDHVGGLAALKLAHPGIQVIASPIEKEYIEGKRKSIRMLQAEEQLENAEESEKAAILQRIEALKKANPVTVDIGAADGQVFDCCGGVEIIASPGHMPGHISVYVRELRTLITGDAMNARSGMLQMANPAYTLDMDEAARSIEKFMGFDLIQIICYHGGIFTGDARQALESVVAGYRASK